MEVEAKILAALWVALMVVFGAGMSGGWWRRK